MILCGAQINLQGVFLTEAIPAGAGMGFWWGGYQDEETSQGFES